MHYVVNIHAQLTMHPLFCHVLANFFPLPHSSLSSTLIKFWTSPIKPLLRMFDSSNACRASFSRMLVDIKSHNLFLYVWTRVFNNFCYLRLPSRISRCSIPCSCLFQIYIPHICIRTNNEKCLSIPTIRFITCSFRWPFEDSVELMVPYYVKSKVLSHKAMISDSKSSCLMSIFLISLYNKRIVLLKHQNLRLKQSLMSLIWIDNNPMKRYTPHCLNFHWHAPPVSCLIAEPSFSHLISSLVAFDTALKALSLALVDYCR